MEGVKEKMLSKEDISAIEEFNIPMLHEAIRQAELKVEDENTRKERIDKRVYTLLSTLIAIIGFLIALILLVQLSSIFSVTCICLSLVCFITSLFCAFFALDSKNYGSLGVYPDTWLQNGIIDKKSKKTENDSMFGYVLSNILHDYHHSTLVSHKSNTKRISCLRIAFIFAFTGILMIAISVIKELCTSCYLF